MSQNSKTYDPLYNVPAWAMVTAATVMLLAFVAGALSAVQVFA